MNRGYFGVGIYHPKNTLNIGTLFRSCQILEASFIFTIGRRYQGQASDTQKSWRHVPLFHLQDINDFKLWRPYDCQLVGIELDDSGVGLKDFKHPQRAIYLLGAEDHGLPKDVLGYCDHIVRLWGMRSFNVSVAGSIVLYHRECL